MIDELSKIDDKLDRILKGTCDDTCPNFERLEAAIKELHTARRQLINSFSLEEQTVSVIKRLTDKWRETGENVVVLAEKVEMLYQSDLNMQRTFSLLYERLRDVIDCPFPNVIEKLSKVSEHLPKDDQGKTGDKT